MNQGAIALGAVSVPFIFGAMFLGNLGGFDFVTGSAFFVALVGGPLTLHDLLMTKAAKDAWKRTATPFLVILGATCVLALVLYVAWGRDVPLTPSNVVVKMHGVFRYCGMLYLAMPVVLLVHLFLDRHAGIYGGQTAPPPKPPLVAARANDLLRQADASADSADFSFNSTRFKR